MMKVTLLASAFSVSQTVGLLSLKPVALPFDGVDRKPPQSDSGPVLGSNKFLKPSVGTPDSESYITESTKTPSEAASTELVSQPSTSKSEDHSIVNSRDRGSMPSMAKWGKKIGNFFHRKYQATGAFISKQKQRWYDYRSNKKHENIDEDSDSTFGSTSDSDSESAAPSAFVLHDSPIKPTSKRNLLSSGNTDKFRKTDSEKSFKLEEEPIKLTSIRKTDSSFKLEEAPKLNRTSIRKNDSEKSLSFNLEEAPKLNPTSIRKTDSKKSFKLEEAPKFKPTSIRKNDSKKSFKQVEEVQEELIKPTSITSKLTNSSLTQKSALILPSALKSRDSTTKNPIFNKTLTRDPVEGQEQITLPPVRPQPVSPQPVAPQTVLPRTTVVEFLLQNNISNKKLRAFSELKKNVISEMNYLNSKKKNIVNLSLSTTNKDVNPNRMIQILRIWREINQRAKNDYDILKKLIKDELNQKQKNIKDFRKNVTDYEYKKIQRDTDNFDKIMDDPDYEEYFKLKLENDDDLIYDWAKYGLSRGHVILDHRKSTDSLRSLTDKFEEEQDTVSESEIIIWSNFKEVGYEAIESYTNHEITRWKESMSSSDGKKMLLEKISPNMSKNILKENFFKDMVKNTTIESRWNSFKGSWKAQLELLEFNGSNNIENATIWINFLTQNTKSLAIRFWAEGLLGEEEYDKLNSKETTAIINNDWRNLVDDAKSNILAVYPRARALPILKEILQKDQENCEEFLAYLLEETLFINLTRRDHVNLDQGKKDSTRGTGEKFDKEQDSKPDHSVLIKSDSKSDQTKSEVQEESDTKVSKIWKEFKVNADIAIESFTNNEINRWKKLMSPMASDLDGIDNIKLLLNINKDTKSAIIKENFFTDLELESNIESRWNSFKESWKAQLDLLEFNRSNSTTENENIWTNFLTENTNKLALRFWADGLLGEGGYDKLKPDETTEINNDWGSLVEKARAKGYIQRGPVRYNIAKMCKILKKIIQEDQKNWDEFIRSEQERFINKSV